MVSTLSSALSNIPESWIFEYYCNLEKPLDDSRVTIKSVFNINDTKPSMHIYYRYGRYIYKDFSSGNGGTALDLVSKLFNISEKEASLRIVKDYIRENPRPTQGFNVEMEPSEIIRYKIRSWNNLDATFWKAYHYSSNILEYFNVRPLYGFQLKKADKVFTIKHHYIYGFFKKDGSLYKIYQPFSKTTKYLKVDDYIQGIDQIQYKNNLIITSSLKDIIALWIMNKEFDYIAPDSENTVIDQNHLIVFKSLYKNIYTLFDNDQPGITSSTRYEKYNISAIRWELEKDPSDSLKKHGITITKTHFNNLIHRL